MTSSILGKKNQGSMCPPEFKTLSNLEPMHKADLQNLICVNRCTRGSLAVHLWKTNPYNIQFHELIANLTQPTLPLNRIVCCKNEKIFIELSLLLPNSYNVIHSEMPVIVMDPHGLGGEKYLSPTIFL